MLVHAYDEGWLSDSQRATLARAGLDRSACLKRISQSWAYLANCHVTGQGRSAVDGKQWGRSWQSPLWVGASGLAALLVWDGLDSEVHRIVERVVVDEANCKIGVAPRDASPGNTAAEENGWDTHAPAIAIALFPKHPNVAKWLRAAQLLAVNTYSVRTDHDSNARLGNDRVGDVVHTVNLADDFTLDNHGFFHPSYLKVSGQELGEAWAMLALGDRRHGTSFAPQLEPYALHHVADTWQKVARLLLLPDGEFAYPSGRDWAMHLSTDQSYFAFITTALRDPVAALAERRGFTGARRRMQASPGNRIYGATNFEWWWDPIFLKRASTAMLHFILTPEPAPEPAPASCLTSVTDSFFFPDARIVGYRTPRYFASVSMRRRPNGLVIPLGRNHLDHPYVTTPRVGSILPAGTIDSCSRHTHTRGIAVVMKYSDGSHTAMVGLCNVVLWLASGPLSPLAIENDNLTGSGRRVQFAGVSRVVPALVPMEPFSVPGTWLNIDDQIGLITDTGFRYVPAGKYTRRSAAEDLVGPNRGLQGTCLLVTPRYSAAETEALAKTFTVCRSEGQREVQFRDGPNGPLVCVRVNLGRPIRFFPPISVSVNGQVSDRFGLAKLADGNPESYAVLRNPNGDGPVPESPVALEFRRPPGAEKAHVLRIVPRARYGPREVTLGVHRAGSWHDVATVRLGFEQCDLKLTACDSTERFRLTISKGWDRGESLSTSPRNTQIAELSFLVTDQLQMSHPKPVVPFSLRIIEPVKKELPPE